MVYAQPEYESGLYPLHEHGNWQIKDASLLDFEDGMIVKAQ